MSKLNKIPRYLFLGQPDKEHDVEAVYVGAVGARFEKPNFMEWQEIIYDRKLEQNVSKLSDLFLNFYNRRMEQFGNTFEDFQSKSNFNFGIYSQRIAITAETYLLEANQRGSVKNLEVHVIVVGLGLGVWELNEHQVDTPPNF